MYQIFLFLGVEYVPTIALISIAVLIPIFLSSMRRPSRPSEWWFFGVSALIGYLVAVIFAFFKGGVEAMTFAVVAGIWPALIVSMFGSLWHMSSIGYSSVEPIGTAAARVVLLLYVVGAIYGSIVFGGVYVSN